MNAKQEMLAQEGTQVVPADAQSIMQVISRAAADPNTDVGKLERLTALYERIVANAARAAYMDALSELQDALPQVGKRGRIDIGRGKPQAYALWEDINEQIKPILHEHGFALSFRTGSQDGKPTVTGILSHRGGHAEETTMVLPIDASGSKNAVQAIGSSTSYGKRYTAAALLNLTFRDEDDDGKAAGIGDTISDEQIKTLQSAIVEVGADLPKFLQFFKVAKLDELPAGSFEQALQLLQQKAGKK